jgi:hypothetical protein
MGIMSKKREEKKWVTFQNTNIPFFETSPKAKKTNMLSNVPSRYNYINSFMIS